VEDRDLCAKLLVEPFGQSFAVSTTMLAEANGIGAGTSAMPAHTPWRHLASAGLGTPQAADIAVLDSDADLRDRLDMVFRSIGLRTLHFAEPGRILEQDAAAGVRCLVSDVRLPGVSGLQLQARLRARNIHTPMIFLTSYGDIKMSVLAMKAGAVDFLTKPAREQDLIDAVMVALDRDHVRRQAAAQHTEIKARAATLTPREARVLSLVTAGLMNKQIAAQLGVSEVTAKLHRASLMRKMAARHVAELTRMAAVLDAVAPASPGQTTLSFNYREGRQSAAA
jgi:FixJ family two-component response regulator